ncbi:unnamed protein product [Parascedosporium putredinis]|uniref:Endoplasmic reticulum lectin n=1 Tax=Parascedosporium putredinis TaxID=1442378 RepID=A0A9P1HD98_9PEZI|nr:unnamed protein product [Parascedosporium putredinis]CAI8004093.1 unnamed protein product [Parascedosporium putredinis]
MRRLCLPLLALAQQSVALQRQFSIHDDLYAHPQFDVIFSEDFISEHAAQSILDHVNAEPTYSADFSSPSDLVERTRPADGGDAGHGADDAGHVKFAYELMNLPPNRYLCSIPVLEEARPENQTAADLAKAAEAKEIQRASQRGWELLKPLENECIHHIDGWWSYRFCYGKDIVQYHALPHIPDGRPPVQDPDTLAYILGRAPGYEPGKKSKGAKKKQQTQQQEEEQRFLVQRLGLGTICDLTGRERTIEIQYQCMPTLKTERISWVKEVTTCAYLMQVNTPRLCSDVAFLPPKETKANPITCRPILTVEDINSYSPKAVDAMTNAHLQGPQGNTLVSNPLLHPRGWCGKSKTKSRIQILASRTSLEDGGKHEELTDEQLKAMDLNPSLVDDMKKRLQKMAGDAAWKLVVVELANGEREIRGILDVDDDDENFEKAAGAELPDGAAGSQGMMSKICMTNLEGGQQSWGGMVEFRERIGSTIRTQTICSNLAEGSPRTDEAVRTIIDMQTDDAKILIGACVCMPSHGRSRSNFSESFQHTTIIMTSELGKATG